MVLFRQEALIAAFVPLGSDAWFAPFGVYPFGESSPDGQALRDGQGYSLAFLSFGKGWCCLPSHRPPSGLSHRVKGAITLASGVMVHGPLDTA